MCPDHPLQPKRQPGVPLAQGGFSIVSAIFLLVVLSALGAFMVTFSTVQHTTSAMDVRGAQAYQAARAGIEWGAYRVLRGTPSCIMGQVLNDVPGFTVTVDCAGPTAYTEGVTPVAVYQITSTARSGTLGGISYVERQLQATISR